MIGLTNGKDPPRRTGFSERKDHRIACQNRFPSYSNRHLDEFRRARGPRGHDLLAGLR